MQLDKNFSLNYEIGQLPYCCGIWEVGMFSWDDNNPLDDFSSVERDRPRGQCRFNTEAKRIKQEALRTGKCCMCTLIDQNEANKMMLKAFLNAGWREDRKVRSNHGNYYIHLLSIQRRKR